MAYILGYSTTEKGLRFLDTYNQMSDVVKTEQQTVVNPKEFLKKHTIDGYNV
jgi:hypothetical protein